jgi:predicted O-methyltransferase YrrM
MNNSGAPRNQSPNGHFRLADLPSEVSHVIQTFFAQPIKLDANQAQHDIRLSALTESEARLLAQLVLTFAPGRSLEVGLAGASSCVAIAAARRHIGLSEKHIALDPFQQTSSGSLGLLEIERAGLADYVSWFPERSENYLGAAAASGEKFDFAFVDGAHDTGQTVTDAFYIHRILNPGGLVAFHDSSLFSTGAAVYYLVLECGYSVLPLPADSAIKRIGRSLHYVTSVGPWYARHVAPKLHGGLVALRRND